MPFGSLTRDEWVERTARLICIRDPLVKLADAELLADVLWDRPLADVPESTRSAVRTLDQLRHPPGLSPDPCSAEPLDDDLDALRAHRIAPAQVQGRFLRAWSANQKPDTTADACRGNDGLRGRPATPPPLPVDIAALARRAGIPSDEPAIGKFAKLIAIECMRIFADIPRGGRLSWLPADHIDAVTDELSARILEAFEVEDPIGEQSWFDRICAAMRLLHPDLAVDDCWDGARAVWLKRFAARLHELEPARDPSICEEQAESVARGAGPWFGREPGAAATHWYAVQGRTKAA